MNEFHRRLQACRCAGSMELCTDTLRTDSRLELHVHFCIQAGYHAANRRGALYQDAPGRKSHARTSPQSRIGANTRPRARTRTRPSTRTRAHARTRPHKGTTQSQGSCRRPYNDKITAHPRSCRRQWHGCHNLTMGVICTHEWITYTVDLILILILILSSVSLLFLLFPLPKTMARQPRISGANLTCTHE